MPNFVDASGFEPEKNTRVVSYSVGAFFLSFPSRRASIFWTISVVNELAGNRGIEPLPHDRQSRILTVGPIARLWERWDSNSRSLACKARVLNHYMTLPIRLTLLIFFVFVLRSVLKNSPHACVCPCVSQTYSKTSLLLGRTFFIRHFIVIHPLTISRVPSDMKILLDDCPEG